MLFTKNRARMWPQFRAGFLHFKLLLCLSSLVAVTALAQTSSRILQQEGRFARGWMRLTAETARRWNPTLRNTIPINLRTG